MLKKYFKIISLNIFILIFGVEILSFILTKVNIIPNGLPPNITLNAHEEFSYWHPKNSEFKIATKCWESKVKFNNIGIKSNNDIAFNKTKKRIAIIGDSMTENKQLSNDEDFASILQKLLPKYEVINFSVSSVGLADQINIYKKLIKKFDIDYLFMYVTFNDFSDNHYLQQRPNRVAYKIDDGIIKEINIDKSNFFKFYNSKWNNFKRNYLIYIKKYTYSFKTYYYLKWEFKSYSHKIRKKNKSNIEANTIFNERYIIYEYLVKKANNEIFNEVSTLIFLNPDNNNFINNTKEIRAIKKIYKDYNFFDPKPDFIAYLKDKDILKKPYLGYSCDAHYSSLGAELMAKYTLNKFIEFRNNN